MCLLTKQTSSTVLSDSFLADVYSKNRDGLGVMYAEKGKIHIYKCLPTNAKEFIDFYRKHAEGKDCVWHARMQTHGDIDLDNCHPYMVTEGVWMAHNGVLSTGNDNDKTRSDTWHFIQNFLRPALTANPNLLLDQDFQNFLGKMIGPSNKFGFVRCDGEIVLINEQAGVEYQGAWLSNTYAWSYFRFMGIKEPTKMYPIANRYSGWSFDEYDYDESYATKTSDHIKDVSSKTKQLHTKAQLKPMIKAAVNSFNRNGARGLEQWVFDAPHKAAAILAFYYDDLDEIDMLPYEDELEASAWIEDLITSDTFAPSMYS